MKELFSKDRVRSILETISLKEQTERSKKAILELPTIAQKLKQTFTVAPYLFGIYLIIAAIDVQHRINTPNDGDMFLTVGVMLVLLTAANALSYVETYNTHTSLTKIVNAGRYVTWRILRLTAVTITTSLAILVGIGMFLIPGLYLSLRLSLAPSACIIDDLTVKESIQQSLKATEGQLTMIYTVYSAFGLFFIPTILLLVLTSGITEIIIVFLLYGIYPPIIQVALATLYLNGTGGNNVNIYFDTDNNTTKTADEPTTTGTQTDDETTTSDAVAHPSSETDTP